MSLFGNNNDDKNKKKPQNWGLVGKMMNKGPALDPSILEEMKKLKPVSEEKQKITRRNFLPEQKNEEEERDFNDGDPPSSFDRD